MIEAAVTLEVVSLLRLPELLFTIPPPVLCLLKSFLIALYSLKLFTIPSRGNYPLLLLLDDVA